MDLVHLILTRANGPTGECLSGRKIGAIGDIAQALAEGSGIRCIVLALHLDKPDPTINI
jgi:hypothetical protein